MLDSLFSMLLLGGMLAGTTRKKRAVTVEGIVAGLPDGIVKLINQSGTAASSKLIAGEFSMKLNVSFPNDYFLLFENGHRIPVVIEKEYVYAEIDFTSDDSSLEINQFSSKKLLPMLLEAEY